MRQNINIQKQIPTSNLYGLDVLRGIAIIVVYYFHASLIIYGQDFDLSYNGFFCDFQNSGPKASLIKFFPFYYGFAGVELFLLISGFLIHYSFLKTGNDKLDIFLFFNKRFWRIYPPYLLALLFFAACQNDGNLKDLIFLKNVLYHVFLMQNFDELYFFSFNPSFWSLALEFQLYLFYPILLCGMRRMSPNVILVITALIYGIATYYVWIHGYSMKSGLVIFFSIPRFLLIWYLGVFLADKFVNSEHYKPISIKWLWFSVCIFLLSKCIRPFNENQILMAAIVSYIAIYICLGINWDSPKLIFRILANIGKCSYSIYLIHQPYMKDLMKSVSFLQLSKFHHQSLEFIDATIVFGIIYLISNSTYYLIEVKSINIGKSIYENIKNRGIFNCKGNQI